MPPSTILDTLVDTSKLKALVASGSVSLEEIAKALSTIAPAELPAKKVPLPAKITEKQQAALELLSTVFGEVSPAEARALTPSEVTYLMTERLTLDEVEGITKKRKESIRTIILNHIDAEFEEDDSEVARDKDGHILRPTKIVSEDHEKVFSWEVSHRGGTLDVDALRVLDESGELDHDTYLSLTDQVRVINEQKVMLALQKNPDLVDVLAKAITPTKKIGSLNLR